MTALHISLGRVPSVPIEVLLASIPRLPRAALNQLVERAIERMDTDDGDSEVEANGDELDGDNAEDAFHIIGSNCGGYAMPGCPIADPGEANGDAEYAG